MRMTQPDYDYLQTNILNLLADYTEEHILAHKESVKFVHDQFTAFVWSIMHHLHSDVFDRLYKQGYNDSHIETALKRILKKYQ